MKNSFFVGSALLDSYFGQRAKVKFFMKTSPCERALHKPNSSRTHQKFSSVRIFVLRSWHRWQMRMYLKCHE